MQKVAEAKYGEALLGTNAKESLNKQLLLKKTLQKNKIKDYRKNLVALFSAIIY